MQLFSEYNITTGGSLTDCFQNKTKNVVDKKPQDAHCIFFFISFFILFLQIGQQYEHHTHAISCQVNSIITANISQKSVS